MQITEALAVVKAAGYRVAKPKQRKQSTGRVGPTFVAEFADGEITRMSTYTSLEKLDIGRGVRLSRAAYQTRRKGVPVPEIVAARFEQDGKILAQFESGQLEWVHHANMAQTQH